MLLWTWLFACHGGDGTDTTPSTDGATSESGTSTGTSSSSTSTSGTPTDPGVTFYHDVRPLLAESCARCHTGTGFGPGPFLDYDVSKQWAEVMLTELEAGQMPPPAADPTCHPYVDQEVYQADPALHDTLKAWIDAGEPAGVDPGTDLQPEAPATLDSPDLVLKTATPRAPNFKDGNEYRCFLIGRIDTDEYVTALEFVIDHPEITHHALLLLDTGGTAHNKVTDEATQSWGCSVTDLPGGIIHAWAPSGGALTFPQGTGLHLPVGSELIIQMHYYQAVTDVFEDQPGYAFDVAPTVDREMYYLTVGPLWFTIPAGDPSYTKNYKMPVSWVSSSPLDVWGAFPHMHVLGTGYDIHSEARNGDETCISHADQYDFTLQPNYWFDEPVTVQPDDTFSVSCTWDNSADNPLQFNDPPKSVSWGENTQDEMCYGFLYVSEHPT